MEQNNQRNSRKRLNSLILLVAFTAVMLIVSTYAWFSTQKNVTIGGLKGKVNVAEGLQISLDGAVWVNSIDLGSFATDTDGNPTTSSTYLASSTATFEKPYTYSSDDTGNKNVTPTELLPASTAGKETGTGITTLKMYRGNITDNIKLDTIKLVDEMSTTEEPGYFAFDVFLQNTSGTGVTTDVLQLESNSSVTVNSGKEATGLQNTVRVGFALFDTTGALNPNNTPAAQSIVDHFKDKTVTDIAIWEPNAYTIDSDSDTSLEDEIAAHVPTIVSSMGYLKLSSTDATAAGLTHGDDASTTTIIEPTAINGTAKLPTYALTASSIDAETIQTSPELKGLKDTFDWQTPSTGLAKVNALQTPTAGVSAAQALVSASNGTTQITIPANAYVKMRIYVWLEGQDVDCLNYASLGGGVTLDIGVSKPGTSNPS